MEAVVYSPRLISEPGKAAPAPSSPHGGCCLLPAMPPAGAGVPAAGAGRGPAVRAVLPPAGCRRRCAAARAEPAPWRRRWRAEVCGLQRVRRPPAVFPWPASGIGLWRRAVSERSGFPLEKQQHMCEGGQDAQEKGFLSVGWRVLLSHGRHQPASGSSGL